MAEEAPSIVDRSYEGIKSISTEIKDYTKQRFGHPFFFSLIISFVVYNWRPFSIFFFSKRPIETVINEIWSYSYYGSWLWPLISAVVYTAFFPFFRNWIADFLKTAIDAEHKARHLQNMDLAEYKRLEASIEYKIAISRSGTNELTALQSVITEKDGLINSLQESLNESAEQISELDKTAKKAIQENTAAREELAKKPRANSQTEGTNFSFDDEFYVQVERLKSLYPHFSDDQHFENALLILLGQQERQWLKSNAYLPSFIGIPPLREQVVNSLINNGYVEKTQSGIFAPTPKLAQVISRL